MGSKTSDHIQINIRMPNPSQEPPASFKAPNKDLKDMDVLCTFKIKIESQNLEYMCTRDQTPYPNHYQDAKPQSGTSSILILIWIWSLVFGTPIFRILALYLDLKVQRKYMSSKL